MKRPFPVLTMTTDWGLRDHYVGSFKGQLLSRSPQAHIIDISHEIEQFDILQASYIVKNCFSNFPVGSVHFIVLSANNVQKNSEEVAAVLAVKCMDHIFIGNDSGIFSLIFENEPVEIYKLSIDHNSGRANMLLQLSGLIGNILNGESVKDQGKLQENFKRSYLAQSSFDPEGIRAIVLYIDDFGNAIVNIKEQEFESVRNGREVLIHFRRADFNIKKISKTYEDAIVGEIVAFFNEDGYLEIALNRASAAGLLGIKVMDSIRIQFYDKQNS